MSIMEESTMGKLFVPYKESLELKELGFDEPCFMKIWWLNGIDFDTKKSFKPYITINDKEIKFKYNVPKKHPLSGFVSLDLQIPTFSQAFRFFREKHGYLQHITYFDPVKAQTPGKADYQGVVLFPHQEIHHLPKESYNNYEEAELACLRKLIDVVKENK